ncbi:MAG: hypothetical protein ACTSXX_06140 [Candidatus Baldrarchaeia archaeon]
MSKRRGRKRKRGRRKKGVHVTQVKILADGKTYILDLNGDREKDILRVYERKKGSSRVKVANVKFSSTSMRSKRND